MSSKFDRGNPDNTRFIVGRDGTTTDKDAARFVVGREGSVMDKDNIPEAVVAMPDAVENLVEVENIADSAEGRQFTGYGSMDGTVSRLGMGMGSRWAIITATLTAAGLYATTGFSRALPGDSVEGLVFTAIAGVATAALLLAEVVGDFKTGKEHKEARELFARTEALYNEIKGYKDADPSFAKFCQKFESLASRIGFKKTNKGADVKETDNLER